MNENLVDKDGLKDCSHWNPQVDAEAKVPRDVTDAEDAEPGDYPKSQLSAYRDIFVAYATLPGKNAVCATKRRRNPPFGGARQNETPLNFTISADVQSNSL